MSDDVAGTLPRSLSFECSNLRTLLISLAQYGGSVHTTGFAVGVDRAERTGLQRSGRSKSMQVARAGGPAAETAVAAAAATIRDPEGKRLVAACLAADPKARARFQQQFGQLIYRFAECAAGGAHTEPGDFYVYLFEDDRIFKRLRSYEGRASLTPFVRGFVLPDLFKQFQTMRAKHTVVTVSLDTDCVREPSAACAPPVGSLLEATASAGMALFRRLSPEKQLLVKLLYVEDFDLDLDELRLLAERSGRSLREAIERVEQARESVRQRETKRREKLGEAESAAQWILQYERRLARVADDLGNLPPASTQAERLREQRAELERKLIWRQEQRAYALAESERATVTLRYREIAEILNQPIGTVSAQVTRTRQELLQLGAQLAGRRSIPLSPADGEQE
jgi:hypothetical protein